MALRAGPQRGLAAARACRHGRTAVGVGALLLFVLAITCPAVSPAEQAAQPTVPAAGRLDTGGLHTCAVLADATVRCWGYGADGQLGYGNADTIGDDETPSSVGPINLGPGRTATAISAGDFHTCALLDDGSVRCWGFGGDGRLGYGNQLNVSAPASVGPVDLGAGRTAKAISAGGAHTCALLDDGSVRCWGFGGNGRLGYANRQSVGDPASVGPVDLGRGRTARAISAGEAHTCAVLDDGSVRCWGYAGDGRLGYLNTNNDIGDDETPASAGPVGLGPGRTAKAISAGGSHTCAVLDDGTVRCWGFGGNGRLGYANTDSIGDDETPGSVGPVDVGTGRTAKAISVGDAHTCALLDNSSVRCWGYGAVGQLGYANTSDVGDNQTPGSVGPVDLGGGRAAMAISAGGSHTCALLDDGSVRCWGSGANGRLGYCNEDNVGDIQTPGSVGRVNLEPGDGGAGCVGPDGTSGGRDSAGTAPAAGATQGLRGHPVDPLYLQAVRARGLRSCLAAAARRPKRHRSRVRRDCLKRYGRTPGRVKALHARVLSSTQVVLFFAAPGSDGPRPPAAREYLIKQSPRPIRSARDFGHAQTLCHGRCRFNVTAVGTKIKLTITHLRPHSTYYYVIAARDNVSDRPGLPSVAAGIRTR